MKIHVYGLGYVGCVSAACLAKAGHEVVGLDIDANKVAIINAGRSPIIEPDLGEIISDVVSSGALSAATEPTGPADVSIVCVGTPSSESGSLSLAQVVGTAHDLARMLKTSQSYRVVAIRSTVLPGTVEETVLPILSKESGKTPGKDFGLCMIPEFMREGSSVRDFAAPPFTVIGEYDTRSGDLAAKLFEQVDAPLFRTEIRTAEMIKYACNAFHAVKVCFANEIGNICKAFGIDSHAVMDIFCQDTKLNLSPYYLKPGFAFGGSCLPKDLRAILHRGRHEDMELPLMDSLLRSNRHQVQMAYRWIRRTGKKRIAVLGLSFKSQTDDLRESPILELIEMLLGKGFSVSIYDAEVSLAKVFGANREYIERAVPHVSSLMRESAEDAIGEAELVVVSKKSEAYLEAIRQLPPGTMILDLVRLSSDLQEMPAGYDGLCW